MNKRKAYKLLKTFLFFFGKIFFIFLLINCPQPAENIQQEDNTDGEEKTLVIDVAAANTHSLFLFNDGSVWACGANGSYQTGIDINVADKHEPQKVSSIPDIKYISCGYSLFSLAVTQQGEVYGWGDNLCKQLGAQDSGEITMPKLIEGISDAIAVGAGLGFSIALKNDTSVYAWGSSGSGVLGCEPLPFPYNRETPEPVLLEGGAPLTNIVQISVGYGHTLAMDASGDVWGWGNNNWGQLAHTDATLPDYYAPYAIKLPLPPDVIKVAAGIQHSIALLANGEVMTWGRGHNGVLGVGIDFDVTSDTNIPDYVVKMSDNTRLNNIIDIAAGSLSQNTIALDSTGTVWICGVNGCGQAGYGSTDPLYYNSVLPIPGLPDNIIKIIPTQVTVLALTKDGRVYAWGNNRDGQIGINNPDMDIVWTPTEIFFEL